MTKFSFIIKFFVILTIIIFLYDIIQKKHTIWRNFPIIGHFRNIFISIGAGIRQYWVASDKEEMPFSRYERSWIYSTSKKENNNFGFGTTEQLYETGYPILKHAVFAVPDHGKHDSFEDSNIPCTKIIGKSHNRLKPYHPKSIVNISAMSYGSLGKNAVKSLNIGAKHSLSTVSVASRSCVFLGISLTSNNV